MLGTAQFQLADIMQANNLTFQQHCPVKIITNEIIVGRLTIKAELGCRGLHFGADFLEAISLNSSDNNDQIFANNIHKSHLQYLECSNQCSNQYKSHKYFEHELKSNDWYDTHDEHTEDKSDTSSTPVNLDTHSNNAQKLNSDRLKNMNDDMSNKDLSHKLCKSDELIDESENELNGLFHIGHINYCSWYQTMLDTFLVCRPFWTDCALVTESCQNKTNDENYQLNYIDVSFEICGFS